MKESIKIDGVIADKVRREAKKRAQKIGGFLELAAKQAISPQYFHHDNSDAFRKYLDDNKIKWKPSEHSTILVDVSDPFRIGMEWGIFKYKNSPYYKEERG